MPGITSPETILWLLRHPEPEVAAAGRCYGSLDLELSANGLLQAHATAKVFARETLSAIYTSPRRRCQQAARILASGRNSACQEIDALREMDFGAFEGRSYDEIAALYPEIYQQWMERPTEVRFPGGETFSEMHSRVIAAVEDVRSRHEGERVALVTHGGVIRIILAEALCMAPATLFRLGQRYGGINRIRYFGNVPCVELMNGSSEL